jgi:hypothetical protein
MLSYLALIYCRKRGKPNTQKKKRKGMWGGRNTNINKIMEGGFGNVYGWRDEGKEKADRQRI